MLKNHLLVALRNLARHRGHTALAVSGLALGMAVCLLILAFAWEQKTYDRFHPNADRVVRILSDRVSDDGEVTALAATPAPLAEALVREAPGIEQATRLGQIRAQAIYEGKVVALHGLYVEPSFFDLFDFAMEQGDARAALATPGQILLTPKAVAALFGTGDAVGQTVTLEGHGDFVVAGVLAPSPGRSHLTFDVLASFATLATTDGREALADWNNSWTFATYLLLDRPSSAERVAEVLPAITQHVYAGQDERLDFRVQPLGAIALGPALAEPLSLVLSDHLAHALFGDADPLGQTLVGAGELTYTVTGIVEDVPAHSHLRYHAFASWSSLVPGNGGLEAGWLDRWLPQAIFTYVLLRPGADPAALEAKLHSFMATHFSERADQYHFYLQPLRDLYLGSTDVLYQRSMVQGNRAYVYVLGIVGVLILLIACANFTNLATARAMQRGKEVGVRKSVGAQRGQLVVRFLGEAVVLVGLALGVALALVEGFRPAFNAFTGKAAPAYAWAAPEVLFGLAGLTVLVVLTAGLYPAVVLSGFRPARALKGSDAGGGHRFRRVLVTAQFTASIALLIGTAVVYQQMRFAQTQHPGYDREQIVVLPIGPTDVRQQVEAFREELVRHPGVAAATGSSDVPGESFSTYTIVPEGRQEDEGLTAAALFLDDTDLLATYGMDLAAGRFFASDRPADSSSVVINAAMARTLGWTEAIGKRLDVPGEGGEHTVIGVVEDFQTASMHQEVAPLFMALQPSSAYVSVRITGEDVSATLAHLRATWERFEPRYPFDYSFLDDTFAQLYAADRQLMRTLGLFAGLAVLIACLGLFGLAAYAAQQRRKEIGVRKVLGASVGNVVALLTRDFAALVLVGFAVAAPLAWWAMDRWLDGFAYRIDLGPGVFVAAGLVALAVALAAVSGQAFRAAATDPVDALRTE